MNKSTPISPCFDTTSPIHSDFMWKIMGRSECLCGKSKLISFPLSPLHVLYQSLWSPIEALITQVSIIFQINLKYQFYLMDNQFFFPAHASLLSWVWVRVPNEFYYDFGLIICVMMVVPLSTLGFSLLNIFKGKVCMNPPM